MRRILVWSAGPICVGAAFLVAWFFELSTEHVLVLAPVIVLGAAAVVGLLVLWAAAARDSLRGVRRRP
jgi:hypothetical protein